MPMAFKPRWGRPQTPMLLNDTENSSCVVGCKFMLRNRCRKNVCHRLSVLPVSFGFGRNRPVVASTNRVKNGFHSVSPLWVISPVCSIFAARPTQRVWGGSGHFINSGLGLRVWPLPRLFPPPRTAENKWRVMSALGH
jgi:hypothetical protein